MIELRHVTIRCPIEGCPWTISYGQLPRKPSTFITLLMASQVLAHVVGTFGEGGRPHPPKDLDALDVIDVMVEAFDEVDSGLLQPSLA